MSSCATFRRPRSIFRRAWSAPAILRPWQTTGSRSGCRSIARWDRRGPRGWKKLRGTYSTGLIIASRATFGTGCWTALPKIHSLAKVAPKTGITLLMPASSNEFQRETLRCVMPDHFQVKLRRRKLTGWKPNISCGRPWFQSVAWASCRTSTTRQSATPSFSGWACLPNTKKRNEFTYPAERPGTGPLPMKMW